MSLELAPDVEARLRDNAEREGLSVDEYLLALMDDRATAAEPVPTTPAEIVKYWGRSGVYEAAPAGPDAPELARQWRERGEEERRQRLFGTP